MKSLIPLTLFLTACGSTPQLSLSTSTTSSNPVVTSDTTSPLAISSQLECNHEDLNAQNMWGDWRYYYQSTVFGSGDRFVTCSATNPSYTSSHSEWYKAGSDGATSGKCAVVSTVSIGGPDDGTWTYLSDGTQNKVTYQDWNHGAPVLYTYSFSSSDCVTQ